MFQRRRESNPDCGEAREDHVRSMARSGLSQGTPRSPKEHPGGVAESQNPHRGGGRGIGWSGNRQSHNLYGHKLPFLALAGGHQQTLAMPVRKGASNGGVV